MISFACPCCGRALSYSVDMRQHVATMWCQSCKCASRVDDPMVFNYDVMLKRVHGEFRSQWASYDNNVSSRGTYADALPGV